MNLIISVSKSYLFIVVSSISTSTLCECQNFKGDYSGLLSRLKIHRKHAALVNLRITLPFLMCKVNKRLVVARCVCVILYTK